MEAFNLFKIAAAFLGGLVAALGGALVYVHTTDGIQTQVVARKLPATRQPAPNPTVWTAPATTLAEEQPQAPSAPPVELPAPSTRTVAHARQNMSKPAVSHPVARPKVEAPDMVASEATSSVVEIAQSVPPQVTMITPSGVRPANPDTPSNGITHAPAVSENSNPIAPEAAPERSNDMPAAPQPHVVTLAAGTPVNIRLGETLSTEHNYSGDTFRAALMTPIILDGFIIADRGSKVLGRIVLARRAGRLEGNADMDVAVTEINTTDGQRVSIETDTFDKRGPSNALVEAAKIGGGAALGAIIGGLAGGGKGAAMGAGAGGAAGTGAVLFSHGRPAVVAAETFLQFRLARPVTITEQLNR